MVACFSFVAFFLLQLTCVFSPVQAKSKTEQCQCDFRYHSRARKRERECYNNLVLARVSGYIFMCICMFLCVYVFAKWCLFVSLSLCAGGEWGSVVCLCVEGPRCSPDFSWELQWSMFMQCRKRQEQATYKLNGQTLKTSTFPLASSSMSSRAMKRAIDTCVVLGCQSKQEVQSIFRFI